MSEKLVVQCDFCGKEGRGRRDGHDRPEYPGFYRYMYVEKTGFTGLWIFLCEGCHKCDTPLCVNPDHLFLSDHKGNMKDMVDKGRSYKGSGEKANSSKLTNEQAAEIRRSTLSQSKLSKIYNVSQSTISRIKRMETYVQT